jgi:hypothetical protein
MIYKWEIFRYKCLINGKPGKIGPSLASSTNSKTCCAEFVAGKTALDLAKKSHRTAVVELLESKSR